MTREDLFQKMNELGKQQVPFVFMIGYDKNLNVISEKTENETDYEFYFPEKDKKLVFKPFPRKFKFEAFPVSFEQYKSGFDVVMNHLQYGNSYLVNYTQPTHIETDLTLSEIFEYSRAPFKLYLKDKFVVFSPERFVKITDRQIVTYPMKGTIDASLPDAARLILSNPKEAAEHATIVDLLRNDLSLVAENVQVKRYRYLETIESIAKPLLQVSSEITGELACDYGSNLGNIMRQMLPAGSVTGAPKTKTLEIIREAEGYERGFYTGVFGYFDGKNLDSAVIIRYIEQTPDGLIFKSGGGITVNSDAWLEYREMIDKVYVPIV
jgi:para-aminobenzoate synthetase component 1